MKPITFACEDTLHGTPAEIACHILDLTRWPEFKGHGVIPGIKDAKFERQTENIVGSRIRVTSTDGSTYVEEITEWNTDARIVIVMKEFASPLAALATSIQETWSFEPAGSASKVTRSFEMQPRSFLTKPALYLISIALKQAISQHLKQIRDGGSSSERTSAGSE